MPNLPRHTCLLMVIRGKGGLLLATPGLGEAYGMLRIG